jgi:hypothetical protein
MVKTKRDIVTKLPTVRDKIQILQRDNVVKLPASKDIKLETAASTKEDVKIPSPSRGSVYLAPNKWQMGLPFMFLIVFHIPSQPIIK